MIKNYIILTPKKLTWPNLKRNRIYVSTEDVIENISKYNILKRNAYFQNIVLTDIFKRKSYP